MKERADGKLGKAEKSSIVRLSSDDRGLMINGVKLPWKTIDRINSVKVGLQSGMHLRLGFKVKPVILEATGIEINHSESSIPTPVVFSPSNFKAWFDEFEKRNVEIRDDLAIRQLTCNERVRAQKILLLVVIVGSLAFLGYAFVLIYQGKLS